MPFEDEIAEELSRNIAKEIDEEIMADLLTQIGWISVKFRHTEHNHAKHINFWLLKNCHSQYRRLSNYYLFEDKKDAEWFILRWA
jgi:hypothetical protein